MYILKILFDIQRLVIKMMLGLFYVLLFVVIVLPEVRVLDVHITPVISESAPPFALERQIQLRCDVIAHPPINTANVQWLTGDGELRRISTSYKYTVYSYPNDGSASEIHVLLTVNAISPKELGVYSCEAKNAAGMYTRRSVDLQTENKTDIFLRELDYLKSETKTGGLVTIHSNTTHVTRTSYVPGNVTQNVTTKTTSTGTTAQSHYYCYLGIAFSLSVRVDFSGG